MLPVIALVGRPNVGKSTFFNRLTRSRDAIVADFPGLTRDRQYGQGRVGSRPYIVIDTGGFEPVRSEGIVQAMAGQAELAIEEADCVLFLCDARVGLTPQDQRIAQHLRRADRPVFLLVNKAEGLSDAAKAEFYELGLGEPYLVSGAHGQGVRDVIVRAEASMQEIEDKTGLIRRFMQMQPKIAAIEEAAQKIKTLNYRQYENPQLEALAAEIMENTAGLKE